MATRVSSSRLIGRVAELAELEAALADAEAGRPTVAFVAGESGVGKSRLVAELERRAEERDVLVLAGDCVDLGESELPYVPLVAALRPLARSGDPALTPELRAAVAPLLPGTAPAADPPDPDAGAQARLFEGLLSLLDSLAADRPVLLLIEDLHWADSSTRAALAFLCRSLASERVLLVASYRPDELHRRHPLRSLLAELERNPNARRLSLAPLTLDELSGQLEDILGEPPAAELLDRLWTRSGGNPLYVEELLAAGLDGRGSAPDTLRDALMLRVERLSEAAQELLRLVAVGQRLDHALLAETSALEPRALRDALREAVDGHILVADEDGTHRFRHALLREVVDDDLLPGERSVLHLALARAVDARVAGGGENAAMSAAVAYHYAAAGDQPAALAASVRAAADAERVHAHGEAAALLERALALWDRVPEPEAKTGIDRVALLVRAGEATGALGDPGRELALYEAASEALGPDVSRTRAAKVYESMARAQRALNRPKSSVKTLERALELLDGLSPDETDTARGRLLANLARGWMLDGRFGDAVSTARRALSVCTEGEMPMVEGHARNTLGVSLAATGDVEAGATELRRAIELAIERDHIQDMSDAYVNFADMLHLVGRTPEAREITAEGRAAVGNRRPIAAMWLDAMTAELAFDAGDWDEAEERLPKPLRWTGTHTRLNLGLRRASICVGRGRARRGERAARRPRRAGEGLERAAVPRADRLPDGRAAAPRGRPRRRARGGRAGARPDRVLHRGRGARVRRRRGRRDRRGRRRRARARPRRRRRGDGGAAAARRPARARRRRRVARPSGRVRAAAERACRGGARRRPPGASRLRARGAGVGRTSGARSRRRGCGCARPRRWWPRGTARPRPKPLAWPTRARRRWARRGSQARSRASRRAPGSRSTATRRPRSRQRRRMRRTRSG